MDSGFRDAAPRKAREQQRHPTWGRTMIPVSQSCHATKRSTFPNVIPCTRRGIAGKERGVLARNILPAHVAQLAEQLTCNEQVRGSSPRVSSTLRVTPPEAVAASRIPHTRLRRQGPNRLAAGTFPLRTLSVLSSSGAQTGLLRYRPRFDSLVFAEANEAGDGRSAVITAFSSFEIRPRYGTFPASVSIT